MRYNSLCFFVVLMLPVAAWCARLTSISASKNTNGGFSIVALHFDEVVPYTVREMDGGQKLQLSIPNCRADQNASADLLALKNALIENVNTSDESHKLVLEFRFTGRMKSNVWETRNPFSLVLDVSPDAKVENKAGSKAITQNQSGSTNEKPVFRPAGAKAARDKEKNQSEGSQKESPNKPTGGTSNKAKSAEATPAAHFQKGLTLKAQGRYEAALEQLKEARKDRSLYAKCTIEIAGLYHQLGRSADEIAEWEELFDFMKERGYTAPMISTRLGGTTVDPGYGASSSEDGALLPVTGTEARGGGRGQYLLYSIIAVLAIVVIWLFITVRKLQTTLFYLSIERDSPEAEELEKTEEPEEEPEKQSASDDLHEPPEETASTDISRGESETESSKASEETALEIISFSEQGLSIPEIAEKLGMGQDEVKLILNLQREEIVPAAESS